MRQGQGFDIEDEATGKKYAQVSINMTNFEQTPLYRVTELVKAEAARYGVVVTGTEIIGLCPDEGADRFCGILPADKRFRFPHTSA